MFIPLLIVFKGVLENPDRSYNGYPYSIADAA